MASAEERAARNARIVELGKKGLTQHEIAARVVVEGLVGHCNQSTVARVLKGSGVGRRKRGSGRRPKPAAEAQPIDTDAEVWPVRGGGDELAALDADLGDIDRAMAVALVERQASAYANLAKLKAQLLKSRQDLIPPEPPDPELDPANTAARDLIRDRLARMAKAHRCPGCGAAQ